MKNILSYYKKFCHIRNQNKIKTINMVFQKKVSSRINGGTSRDFYVRLPHFKSKLKGNLSPIKLHSCVAGRLVVIRKENHLSIT